MNWDEYFLQMAETVSHKSKDPSTKVGCVIAGMDHVVVSTGYNGFPRGIADDERLQDRQTKYAYVVHSEPNAIIAARCDLRGTTIYTWPFPPCSGCAKLIIQAGIRRVVSPPVPEHLKERWEVDLALAKSMFAEALVKYDEIPEVQLALAFSA